MTLLQEWKKKKSWKLTYPIVPKYKSIMNGNEDLDLRELLKKEKHITLNHKTRLSGISEIAVVPNEPNYEEIYSYNENMKDFELDDICKMLNTVIFQYLLDTWDPKIFHLIFCSGGLDSQIISLIIKQLSDVMDLGEFKFICHEPEQEFFKKSMKNIGFDKQHWEVWKEDRLKQEDYYDYGDINRNMNGFIAPSIIFYNRTEIKEKETCLVSGNFGGELLDYPSSKLNYPYFGIKKVNYGILNYFASSPSLGFFEYYYKWKDILMPYLNYSYINFISTIKPKHFSQNSFEKGDVIRTKMAKMLGGNGQFFRGHLYNLKVSNNTRTKINDEYKNSKFYKYFNYLIPVINANPGKNFQTRSHIDSKLYGLATVFEGLDLKYESLPEDFIKQREFYHKEEEERIKYLKELNSNKKL